MFERVAGEKVDGGVHCSRFVVDVQLEGMGFSCD